MIKNPDSLGLRQLVQYPVKGWLTKRGHIVKNWLKRYFILTQTSISYYEDEKLSQKKGEYFFRSGEIKDRGAFEDFNFVFSFTG